MKRLILIGASGHGKVCADIADKNGFEQIIFLDDDESIHKCGRYPVIGRTDDFASLIDEEASFLVSIGNSSIRRRIQETIKKAGGHLVTLIHPMSAMGEDVVLGEGCVVMAGAVINPGSVIGDGVIINTCSSVDHDCTIGDYVHVAVGAHVCGTVSIGDDAWIGAGATIINNLSVCSGCTIGAGAVVIKDVSDEGTYAGVPAGMIRQD